MHKISTINSYNLPIIFFGKNIKKISYYPLIYISFKLSQTGIYSYCSAFFS